MFASRRRIGVRPSVEPDLPLARVTTTHWPPASSSAPSSEGAALELVGLMPGYGARPLLGWYRRIQRPASRSLARTKASSLPGM